MRRRVLQLYIKKQENDEVIFSLAWNIMFTVTKNFLFWIFGGEKYGIFEPKSSWKYDIYWLLKSSCFDLSRIGNTVFFGAKKLIERRYLLITEEFLFWTFRWWEIRSFFESRSWWKDDIYWLLKSSCFELFGDGKYGLFFSQKVDGKMIFTWPFWAFHHIPGLGKYGFFRSVK